MKHYHLSVTVERGIMVPPNRFMSYEDAYVVKQTLEDDLDKQGFSGNDVNIQEVDDPCDFCDLFVLKLSVPAFLRQN